MMKNSFFVLLCASFLISGCTSTPSDTNSTPLNTENAVDGTEKLEKPKAEGRYKKGDELYVYAQAGLVLRDQAAQSGAKIASLLVQTKVQVIDEHPFEVPFSVKEKCGFEIKGHWVKVNAAGKEGYVFDGFLLNLAPGDDEMDEKTFWSMISKLKSSTDTPPKEKNGPEYYFYEKHEWENGIRYEASGYEGGTNSELILPKGFMTFQEAYVFAAASQYQMPENPYKCDCNTEKQDIDCQSKDELAYWNVTLQDDGSILIGDAYAD